VLATRNNKLPIYRSMAPIRIAPAVSVFDIVLIANPTATENGRYDVIFRSTQFNT
jgi:hypothetical protein